MDETTKIAIFKGQKVRKTIHNNEWWFVVEDVVVALTDSSNPKDYINKMRLRDNELSKGYGQIVHTLPVETQGGKQKMNCANTEGVFRIIQSIPSPKAEPFKRWLAKVGYERIQEIEDPELATKRTRALYKAKGYSDDWIEKRMRGIQVREQLTNEWKNREVGGDREYAILTAEISQATFGMTPSFIDQYRDDPNQAGSIEVYMQIVDSLYGRLADDLRPGHFAYQSTLGMRDHAGRQLTTKQIPEGDLFSKLGFASAEAVEKARTQFRERDLDALLH